jgi:hypothetical protein
LPGPKILKAKSSKMTKLPNFLQKFVKIITFKVRNS